MSDLLTITDLEIWTHIGVPEAERKNAQRLLISVGMTLDTTKAAKADDVKSSINYFDVAQEIKELAKTERKTIERFAEDCAAMILKNHPASGVTVTVKKFALPETDHVSIKITRGQ